MGLWGVRLKFSNNSEKVLVLGSRLQAEFYIHMIPMLMVSNNKEVEGVISARIVSIE